MENKKKILFVVPALSNGGAERVVARISSELCKYDYDINILVFFSMDNEYEVHEKVKIHNLSKGTFDDYKRIGTLKRLRLIRKKVKEINPDVILPFINHIYIYTALATLFSKFSKRTYFLVRDNLNYQNFKKRFLISFLNNFGKKIIVQNQGQKDYFSKRKQKKTYIIPNPMDNKYLEYQKDFRETPIRLISVGRLEKQKNYELALHSFAKATRKHSNLEYVIYGKGSLQESLLSLCRELNIEDKVQFKGFCSDFKEIYGTGDIYLMSSHFEGMPNSLAEAIAIGLPVISTDCDYGPRDLILDSKIGTLVKENNEEEFTNALLNMIENYHHYSSLNNYRKEIIKENFSIDKIIKLWMSIL